MDSKRRSTYETMSIPYGRACLKLGLTPNILTVIGLVIAGGAAVALWQRYFWVGILLVITASFADMLDGATARAGEIGTKFGCLLDRCVDRMGEFLILLGIALSGAVHPGWAMFGLFGMWSASYNRAAAESVGGLKNVEVGFVGRLEKFGMLILGMFLESYFPGYALSTAVIAVGVVSFITALQRLHYAYVHLVLKVKEEDDST